MRTQKVKWTASIVGVSTIAFSLYRYRDKVKPFYAKLRSKWRNEEKPLHDEIKENEMISEGAQYAVQYHNQKADIPR
ncbi:hypothetical protein IC619_012355 [Hazenella sp. IB182353]|uniref:hypothetical protein n=1 Tax=Polycladospora coralii TaxID=2771432 RepID=UPI00174718E6|nr:hypothetical protein [Polycladospora coralii]MBS7531284.1 hypothetical protein [Polycladospora coralii]